MLRLILTDQLNGAISSLQGLDNTQDTVYFFELADYFTHVKHHKKKIAFLLSAMRHFAQSLRDQGVNVTYFTLNDNGPRSLTQALHYLHDTHPEDTLVLTKPSEYFLHQEVETFMASCPLKITLCEDNRFLCTNTQFRQWAGDKKQLRMEFFYRYMRKEHDILMTKDTPVGGKWNYDSDNRKPPKQGLTIPKAWVGEVDTLTQSAIDDTSTHFGDHFGDLLPWYFATTRRDALAVLEDFIAHRLPLFGDYQDAMIQGEPWMFHSHISFYLNCGLLFPLECISAAEASYYDGKAPLNAVEGFIRQILGWREFIRGIYWHKMPAYASENFLQAKRALPEFYWTADTKMNCLRQCVSETKQHAYAHHIQRLMVLGNFALLAGLHPKVVNDWYHVVYADAYQWVELPNVSGMILFADGGYLGSKPYAASGAYIDKMSNYCAGCKYKVKEKNGPDACPFNYLYWDFLLRNQDTLRSNQRLGMIYGTLSRMKPEKIAMIVSDSKQFLDNLSEELPDA